MLNMAIMFSYTYVHAHLQMYTMAIFSITSKGDHFHIQIQKIKLNKRHYIYGAVNFHVLRSHTRNFNFLLFNNILKLLLNDLFIENFVEKETGGQNLTIAIGILILFIIIIYFDKLDNHLFAGYLCACLCIQQYIVLMIKCNIIDLRLNLNYI